MNNWILFYHEITLNYYVWNGSYPINITPDGEPWCGVNDIQVTDEEVKTFEAVLNSKARGFKLKKRGSFKIVERGVFVTID